MGPNPVVNAVATAIVAINTGFKSPLLHPRDNQGATSLLSFANSSTQTPSGLRPQRSTTNAAQQRDT